MNKGMACFVVLLIGKTDYLVCLNVSYSDRMVTDTSTGTQKNFRSIRAKIIKIYFIL